MDSVRAPSCEAARSAGTAGEVGMKSESAKTGSLSTFVMGQMPPEMNTAGAEIITTAWLDQRFEPRRIVTAMPKEATEAEKSRPVPSVAATLCMEPYSCHQKSNPCM